MVDLGSIAYSESNDSLGELLKDPTLNNIYNDVVNIYQHNHPNIREQLLQNLLQKYDGHYFVYYWLGDYYTSLQKYNDAVACYRICLQKKPFVDAFLNLAILFQITGNLEMSKELIITALTYEPSELRLLNMIGAIYYLEKDYYVAIEHYKKIIESKPPQNSSLKNIYNNIGFSCSAIGKCGKALNYFEDGLKIKSDKDEKTTELDVQLLQNKLINYDYMYENPEDVFLQFLRINEMLKTKYMCNRTKSMDGLIRIGYISPDFRQHVCMSFLTAIFKYYNRTKFDVYCYANVRSEDKVSETIKTTPGIKWFNINNMTTPNICELIQLHKIDILIDLAGHTNGNKLTVLSQKPAPIQITYLGYPNSTGLTNVDFRITDRLSDPPTTKQLFSEKLIYMPRCFVCYTPSIDLSLIPVIPQKHDFITFGVMNKLNKHNKHTFRAWSEIIKRVPNSVLLIKRDMKSAFDIRVKYLQKLGLTEKQIQVTNFIKDQKDYCNMYNDIDICLDTFPYSGTTTSCDGFLMGTPIITYAIPNRHVSNVTKSMLVNMGFPELVTNSLEEYINCAVQLANNPDKIIYYKNNIRNKFFELMEGQKFVKEYDDLLTKVFNNHM